MYRAFYALVAEIADHAHLDLRLIGRRRHDCTAALPAHTRMLVAGHLAEIFYQRRDILDRFLVTPRRVRLYATEAAFITDGGAAGGDYNVARESIQLVISRLYEGFFRPAPGPCPFLHELGHMLDFFDAGRGRMGKSEGLLPGLSSADGVIYTPEARTLFLRGKRIEWGRYVGRARGGTDAGGDMPLGHPYVFQNDTEFAAGYLEMFFRNPHAFAAQNPTLYGSYVALLRQDPREAWAADFPTYVEQNRAAYASCGRLPGPGITTPPA